MPHVSIIIPALNEEGAIGTVIQEIKNLQLDVEIIVVNDGSTDTTATIAQGAGVSMLQHPLPLGAGRSVKDGVAYASSEYILMIDGDGTYPVDRIPDFLQKLDEGFDLVVGARHGKEYRGSAFKTFARFIFRLIAEFSTGKRIPDINSGMRAFRKSQIESYFPHLCNGFSLPTTMTLAYFFTGKLVTYLPIDYYKRIGVSKVRIVRDSLRTLQYIAESVAFFNPIKLFLLLSFAVLGTGIIASCLLHSPTIFFSAMFVAILVFSLGLHAHAHKQRS